MMPIDILGRAYTLLLLLPLLIIGIAIGLWGAAMKSDMFGGFETARQAFFLGSAVSVLVFIYDVAKYGYTLPTAL